MRGLIARILAGQAPSPAENLTRLRRLKLAQDIELGLQKRARNRRPPAAETRRFEHARPKVEQLRAALNQHAQKLRDEAGQA